MSDEVRLIGLRDRAALDPVRLVGVRPPVGVGGGVLSRSVAGLLHADGFDSDTTGDYSVWYETAGSFSVVGGRLRMQPNDDSGMIIQVDGVVCGKCFAQVTFRLANPTSSYPAMILRASEFGYGVGSELVRNSYRYFANTFNNSITLNKTIDGTGTPLDLEAEAGWAGSTDYHMQIHVEDSLQEAWLSLNAHQQEAVDTQWNGENSRGVGFFAREYTSGYTDLDDLIYMKDKVFICTGLSAGQKLKVFDSGDVEIFSRVASGGTATIDVSKYTNTLNALVPVGGWAYVTVTDSGDVELARYTGAIYPGDQYEYDGPPTPPAVIPETNGIVRITANDLATRYPTMVGADILTIANPFVTDTFNSTTRNGRKWGSFGGPRLDAGAGPNGDHALNFPYDGNYTRFFYIDYGKGGDASMGNFYPSTLYMVMKAGIVDGRNEWPWVFRNSATGAYFQFQGWNANVSNGRTAYIGGTFKNASPHDDAPKNAWFVHAMTFSQVFTTVWEHTWKEYVNGVLANTYFWNNQAEWTVANSNEMSVGVGQSTNTAIQRYLADLIYYNVVHDDATVASVSAAIASEYGL